MPRNRFNNTPDHPRYLPLQLKLETIHRCLELVESVQLVPEEIGYGRAGIYTWRKKYILKGAVALMDYDASRGELSEGEKSLSKEIELLKSQIQDMKLDIDILKENSVVLKKTRRQYDSSHKQGEGSDHRRPEKLSENMGRYGYRRIHALLGKEWVRISEKIVRKIMAECGLKVKFKRKIKYNSYKVEIKPAISNIIARNFHVDDLNQGMV